MDCCTYSTVFFFNNLNNRARLLAQPLSQNKKHTHAHTFTYTDTPFAAPPTLPCLLGRGLGWIFFNFVCFFVFFSLGGNKKQSTVFVAFVVFDARRQEAGRLDIVPCCKTKNMDRRPRDVASAAVPPGEEWVNNMTLRPRVLDFYYIYMYYIFFVKQEAEF